LVNLSLAAMIAYVDPQHRTSTTVLRAKNTDDESP
jgi:hypothetical protein